MANYPTPHIKATPSDFAKTVLMPGDPKRAKYIAESFLTDAKLVNDVRGVQGYTGKYNGVSVSVMASGMGMPSMSIYSHELFSVMEVENIIRIGSICGYADDVKLLDVILAMSASTDSNMQSAFKVNGHFAPTASYDLLKSADSIANDMGLSVKIGNVLSADTFYTPNLDDPKIWKSRGVLGVEMETAALYMNAAKLNKNALAILTVSDHVFNGESMPADDREKSLNDMIILALKLAEKLG